MGCKKKEHPCKPDQISHAVLKSLVDGGINIQVGDVGENRNMPIRRVSSDGGGQDNGRPRTHVAGLQALGPPPSGCGTRWEVGLGESGGDGESWRETATSGSSVCSRSQSQCPHGPGR